MGSFKKTNRYSIVQPTPGMVRPQGAGATPRLRAQRNRRVLEPRDALQRAAALGDLVRFQTLDALGAERLDVERGQHGAERHRAAEQLVVELLPGVRGDVAHEAAGERVARAGRIDDVLEWIGRQA